MKKTIEAFLRGYILFSVNGESFLTYSKARAKRVHLCETTSDNVSFIGFHIIKGWTGFYYRVEVIE